MIMDNYILMEYYTRYLKEVRHASSATIAHYTGALKSISKFLMERGKIQTSIYEITDLNELEIIKDYLFSNPDFLEWNNRGHRMYSAAYNNYYQFASGEDFYNIKDDIKKMDIAMPIPQKINMTHNYWKRSSIIKNQALESAGYRCELNPDHHTFISKFTMRPYMEGHHLLPMKFQKDFDMSLDVYANIICLCPTCHRLLHYGLVSEKEKVLKEIYDERCDRLFNSGIAISRNKFLELTKI